MPAFLIAIDQGTTGSTVVVVSPSGEVLGRATREFPQYFPEPGWVEHDVGEIWKSVVASLGAALEAAHVKPSDCVGIGITNQRETTVVWDRATGEAIHRAIVWQDRRTSARCAELKKVAGLETMFRDRTGLVLDPYFSGTKIDWILSNVSGASQRARDGQLAFGTIDSFLIHKLTAGRVHVTDATNACRTLLFDIKRLCWDQELAAALNVPMSVLPEVRTSSEVYGHTSGVPGLPDGIPIAGIAGDQQAAMFGQTCFAVGQAKCTYGTGAFQLVNTGTEPVASKHGLLTTVAWTLGGEVNYALEGSAFIAGAAVQWLRDQLGIIKSAREIEPLASSVKSSEGVVFVPALSGLGAPHWDPDARGLICGLTRGSSAAHIARATLEGIAFQIADLSSAMALDAGHPLERLRVDGGASTNNLLMQFQADLLGIDVDRPSCIETTALGAAYLAGLAVGVFGSRAEIEKVHKIDKTYRCAMDEMERSAHLKRWHTAVERTRSR